MKLCICVGKERKNKMAYEIEREQMARLKAKAKSGKLMIDK